jgi:hypothetical protein
LLAAHEPDGVPGSAIAATVHDSVPITDVVAATGGAGDVIVCHPFLVHSINPTSPPRERIASNVAVHGFEPLRLNGDPTSLSPAERMVAGYTE